MTTKRLPRTLWHEVRDAARETPKMYFSTVKEFADAVGRLIGAERATALKADEKKQKVSSHTIYSQVITRDAGKTKRVFISHKPKSGSTPTKVIVQHRPSMRHKNRLTKNQESVN